MSTEIISDYRDIENLVNNKRLRNKTLSLYRLIRTNLYLLKRPIILSVFIKPENGKLRVEIRHDRLYEFKALYENEEYGGLNKAVKALPDGISYSYEEMDGLHYDIIYTDINWSENYNNTMEIKEDGCIENNLIDYLDQKLAKNPESIALLLLLSELIDNIYMYGNIDLKKRYKLYIDNNTVGIGGEDMGWVYNGGNSYTITTMICSGTDIRQIVNHALTLQKKSIIIDDTNAIDNASVMPAVNEFIVAGMSITLLSKK